MMGKTRASVSRCGNCVYMNKLLKTCQIFGVIPSDDFNFCGDFVPRKRTKRSLEQQHRI